MKFIFALIFIFSFSYASPGEDLFNQGCSFYKAKQWNDARLVWTKAVESGIQSPQLYNNLADASFKCWQENTNQAGLLSAAVIWWERSRILDADNASALHNLKMVRNYLTDENPPPEVPGKMRRLVFFFYYLISWQNQMRIAILFLLLSSAAFAVLYLKPYVIPALVRSVLFICLFGWIFMLTSSAVRRHNTMQSDAAVINLAEAVVHTEPIPDSPEAFTLHEGSRIKFLQTKDGWSEIVFGQGIKGWVKTQFFTKIRL